MPNILLVEDAERIALFVIKGLQAHGFQVTHATSLDLTILDIGLPGISGFDVLVTLRGQRDQAPVIVLTAKDSVDTTLASFGGAADDFMPKPFSFEELLARVKRRIRSPNEAHAESTLVNGEVGLDLLTRRVTAAGIEHDLTARELTMLEFFLRHPRQVMSREQLLSRV